MRFWNPAGSSRERLSARDNGPANGGEIGSDTTSEASSKPKHYMTVWRLEKTLLTGRQWAAIAGQHRVSVH